MKTTNTIQRHHRPALRIETHMEKLSNIIFYERSFQQQFIAVLQMQLLFLGPRFPC